MSQVTDAHDQERPDTDNMREDKGEERRKKKRRSFRRTMVLLLQIALLAVFVIVYILVGAAVMNAFEGAEEKRRKEIATATEEEITEGIVERLEVYIGDRNRSEEITDEIVANISRAITERKAFGNFFSTPRWDYEQSVFFVTTAVTTIGFGTSVINTDEGRAFIVFYTILGIPVTVVFIATLSKLLARLFKLCLKPCRQGMKRLIATYLCLLLAGVVLLIFLPAVVFWQVESSFRHYSTALYFCFITLSTIGFGDVVVLHDSEHSLPTVSLAFYTIFTVLWIFVGLAYLTLLITEAVHGISSIWKRLVQKLPGGSTIAEEEFEERPLEKWVGKASRGLRKTISHVIQHRGKGREKKASSNAENNAENTAC